MNILVFAAVLRRGSYNRMLAAQAVDVLRAADVTHAVTIDHADFHEFAMPMYDGDMEVQQGLPSGAQELIKRVRAADAVIIATPEYNGSIAGTLKNAIDWASRVDPIPFKNKPVLLLGASMGGFAAVRGLWHTRVPLEAVGAYVYPEMLGIARAQQAFDASGTFVEKAQRERLEKIVTGFVRFAVALSAG